jgi:hypothetical protein
MTTEIDEETSTTLGPECFINRELSWLEFNQRVLDQATDLSVPLLERLKFLCIVSSNLDEFFEVRVAGLKQVQLAEAGAVAGVDVTAGLEVEWDRVYRTVLGVAGKRLYEMRLQAPISVWEAEQEGLEAVAGSFRCKEVDL